jgi:hypothetical protein
MGIFATAIELRWACGRVVRLAPAGSHFTVRQRVLSSFDLARMDAVGCPAASAFLCFESVRAIVRGQNAACVSLVLSGTLALVYIVLAAFTFNWVFRLRSGLV